MTHAKFEANRIIFRGGASDLKFAHVYVFGVEVSIRSACVNRLLTPKSLQCFTLTNYKTLRRNTSMIKGTVPPWKSCQMYYVYVCNCTGYSYA